MKKTVSRITASILLASHIINSSAVFGFSGTLSAAESLADQGIITKQSDAKNYQLLKPIIRQEAIAVVGKSSGAVPSEDNGYTCRGVFADVSEGWVCHAVELSADAGIVDKRNTRFRPKDNVSYFEAAVMSLKSSCINPGHALSGSNDRERILARIGEAGVQIETKMQSKAITRGDFFYFIATVRDYANNNPEQIDKSQAGCTPTEEYKTGNLSLQIPSDWEKTIVESGNGVYFDQPDGEMRVYISEYTFDITLGNWYDNTRRSFQDADQGIILSEKPGQIYLSKIFHHESIIEGVKTQNYTYFVPENGRVYEILFAFTPQYFEKYRTLIESTVSNTKLTKTRMTGNRTSLVPKTGDTVLVSYKRNSDSGKISDSGETVFEVDKKQVYSEIEQAVKLMKIGETKSVRVLAKNYFGETYLEETLTPAEFEELKKEEAFTYDKTVLLGTGTKVITKDQARASFGTLTVGKTISETGATYKILEIRDAEVVVEMNNPSALFYGKTLVVGSTYSTESGDITIQSMNGSDVVGLFRAKYTITSQDSTGVRVKIKNSHPLAGENLTFEITLVEIQKANSNTGITG